LKIQTGHLYYVFESVYEVLWLLAYLLWRYCCFNLAVLGEKTGATQEQDAAQQPDVGPKYMLRKARCNYDNFTIVFYLHRLPSFLKACVPPVVIEKPLGGLSVLRESEILRALRGT